MCGLTCNLFLKIWTFIVASQPTLGFSRRLPVPIKPSTADSSCHMLDLFIEYFMTGFGYKNQEASNFSSLKEPQCEHLNKDAASSLGRCKRLSACLSSTVNGPWLLFPHGTTVMSLVATKVYLPSCCKKASRRANPKFQRQGLLNHEKSRHSLWFNNIQDLFLSSKFNNTTFTAQPSATFTITCCQQSDCAKTSHQRKNEGPSTKTTESAYQSEYLVKIT